eukprot:4539220-Heterocapsa_arctica.AAC.1
MKKGEFWRLSAEPNCRVVAQGPSSGLHREAFAAAPGFGRPSPDALWATNELGMRMRGNRRRNTI